MAMQTPTLSAEAVANHITAILAYIDTEEADIDTVKDELRALRQAVLPMEKKRLDKAEAIDDIVQRLSGSLAPPSPEMRDSYEDYSDLDWKRFSG